MAGLLEGVWDQGTYEYILSFAYIRQSEMTIRRTIQRILSWIFFGLRRELGKVSPTGEFAYKSIYHSNIDMTLYLVFMVGLVYINLLEKSGGAASHRTNNCSRDSGASGDSNKISL